MKQQTMTPFIIKPKSPMEVNYPSLNITSTQGSAK